MLWENPDLMDAGAESRPDSERVLAALCRPEAYAHHPAEVVVRETHISWVFLAGEFARRSFKPNRERVVHGDDLAFFIQDRDAAIKPRSGGRRACRRGGFFRVRRIRRAS